MRKCIMPILILLASCGSEESAMMESQNAASPACEGLSVVGRWDNQLAVEIMEIANDCTGVSDTCSVKFSFTPPDASNMTTVTVTESAGTAGCLPVGTHTCGIATSNNDNLLTVDCLGNLAFYDRI